MGLVRQASPGASHPPRQQRQRIARQSICTGWQGQPLVTAGVRRQVCLYPAPSGLAKTRKPGARVLRQAIQLPNDTVHMVLADRFIGGAICRYFLQLFL